MPELNTIFDTRLNIETLIEMVELARQPLEPLGSEGNLIQEIMQSGRCQGKNRKTNPA